MRSGHELQQGGHVHDPEKDRAEGGWGEKNKESPDPESTVGDKDQLHFAVAHPTLPQQFN
jgi:hypothetical protein